ncbi:flagellar basal body L-ring protein FlgH [Altererythrobacter sp. KTW20L]|uniref:flagellar basal body L-ring protein FlgH n=1 Tax=Altererythrobacter sp. KTW20L TaxID=2942210 RepID=UPI0020C10742|nr:flagellar basal body L-ring protein FlgH [Altererythrobacter sp. KTW20L]MCL6251683.1 flagellar basal body L-ring protein FlgH [Altererythrobacter sp. KTW20L]
MTRKLAVILACLATAACGMEGGRPQVGFGPALPPAETPGFSTQANGAIFQPATGYAALHEGTRARRVGDLVTVMLVESMGTSKSTSARTNRAGSAGIEPPSAGLLSFLNPDALNAGAEATFNGQGNASQRSTLNGAIAVTIAEVRSNGTALVVGERQMELSQGSEWVQFAGILRLADISAENRILSSQIADAQIIYGGNGAIQQASRPGWLSRFFNMVSPF